MSLTGPQFQQLQQALLSAFPSHASLAQTVRIGLDENLDAIAGTGILKDVVFQLITWAEAQGRTYELVAKAHKANPGNLALVAFRSLAVVQPPTASPEAGVSHPPGTEENSHGGTNIRFHVPYERNVFFTGREEVLQDIHVAFQRQDQVAIKQAISGLGGVGKTQTALEGNVEPDVCTSVRILFRTRRMGNTGFGRRCWRLHYC